MRLATTSLVLLLLTGCGSCDSGGSDSSSSGSVSTVVMNVPEIHCESCAAKVTEVLSEHPGVNGVTVDVESKRATVSVDQEVFDSEAALAELEDYQFSGSQIVGDDSL